eukprot:gene8911-18143_t
MPKVKKDAQDLPFYIPVVLPGPRMFVLQGSSNILEPA